MSTFGAGYDPLFLALPVPLPTPPAAAAVRTLAYTHFSVLLQLTRKLALATAVNIDGGSLIELDRGNDWHLDSRVPVDQQTGPAVYAKNDLDRGHLVRRRDPVWGTPEEATEANFDSFSFTNAAPQAAGFNQGAELWRGLEDFVLTHADTFDLRLSVFTAPVLAADDPPYRGINIPRRFWKIAAWRSEASDADINGTLAATGYLLDQTPELDNLELQTRTRRAQAAGEPPPLGPFRTFQVPIVDIAGLSGLDLGPLITADRFAGAQPVPVPQLQRDSSRVSRWRRLDRFDAIELGTT